MTLKMQSIFTHKGNTHCKNLILSPLKKHKSHSMLPWSEDDVIHELAPHRSKYQGCKEQHICKTMLEDKLLRNILQECVIFMTHYVLLKTYNNKYAFNISKTAWKPLQCCNLFKNEQEIQSILVKAEERADEVAEEALIWATEKSKRHQELLHLYVCFD